MNHKKRNLISDKLYTMLNIFRTDEKSKTIKSKLRRHSAVELTYVTNGKGECVTDGVRYAFDSGDVFMFSPNEAHFFDFCTSAFETLSIHIEPRLVWTSGADFPDSSLLQIFFDKDKSFKNIIPSTNKACAEIKNLMLEAEDELLRKDKEYAIAVKIKIAGILLVLLRSFNCTKSTKHTSSRSYNLEGLEKTMQYIDEHLETDLDLETLAENASLSRSHFCSVFKRYNGITPWDYITIRRIEKSVPLLSKADKTKLEIARGCGFNNTANFYRSFKKVTGCSPKDFISAENI